MMIESINSGSNVSVNQNNSSSVRAQESSVSSNAQTNQINQTSSEGTNAQKGIPSGVAEKTRDAIPSLDDTRDNDENADQRLIKAIENANKKLRSSANTECQFAIHQRTKQIMIKIMNTETKEVIREIPPEKSLDMIAKMWDMAGLFVDEKM